MAWHETIIEDLADDLGPAPKQLLVIILTLAPAESDSQTKFIADKSDVVANLEKKEGKKLSDDTLRKRIQLINQAANILGEHKFDGDQPLRVQSRKTQYEIIFAPRLKETLESRKARLLAGISTRADINIDASEIQTPRVHTGKPNFQIFVSHAHENKDVEDVVKSFAADLKIKLENLPHKYRDKFSLSLWLDHFDMRAIKPFVGQMDEECGKSALAIFLLSDKWYGSDPCKRERSFFIDNRAPENSRFLRIQLSGNWQDGDPEFIDAPCFPEAWRSGERTLLSVWKLTSDCKDKFVTRIRDEICADIDAKYFSDNPDSFSGSGHSIRRGHERYRRAINSLTPAEILKHAAVPENFEKELREGITEIPRVSKEKGGDGAENAIPILSEWAWNADSTNRKYLVPGNFGDGKTTTVQSFAQALDQENFEEVVREGNTENPRVLKEEGGDIAEDAIELLSKWACAADSPNRVYALLGSFGAGKTTTCQLFAQTLNEKREKEATGPYPIYLDFRRLNDIYDRDRTMPPTLANIIRQSLRPEVRDSIDAERLLKSLRLEPCVIIFDGLDEVGTRIGQEKLSSLYRELLEIVPSDGWKADRKKKTADWKASPIRILVTCRTHFFRNHMQQKSVLSENDRSPFLRKKEGAEPLRTIYMAPFDLEQIKSFFCSVLGIEEGTETFESISRVPDLSSLAKKPIMARFIAELEPDLKDDSKAGRVINAARIYDHLFRRALERDQDKRLLLTPADREKMLESLSQHLWMRGSAYVSIDDLDDWFDAYATKNEVIRIMMGSDRDARGLLHTELRNASLLVREHDDSFRFVHTSFYEYFLAKSLLQMLLEGALGDLAAMPEVSRETFEFMVDLVATRNQWEEFHKACDKTIMPANGKAQRAFIMEVRAALLRAGKTHPLPPGADFSELDLRRNRSISNCELSNVSFSGANLLQSQFKNITFKTCDFSGANLAQVQIDNCRFINCRGAPRNVTSARVNMVEFDAVSEAEIFASLKFHSEKRAAQFAFSDLPEKVKVRISGGGGSIISAVFSPDGEKVLTASTDRTARLWAADSGEELKCFKGHEHIVFSAAFSPDSEKMLTASLDGTARLWDVASGAELKCFKGHERIVRSAVFSPDSEKVLTASSDGTARSWAAGSGEELKCFKGHEGGVDSAVFSPDGEKVLTASTDGTARLWDVASGAELKCFKGHGSALNSAVFSPDGEIVLTASEDRTARLWAANSGAELKCFKGHERGVDSAVFSPDGEKVLTASDDGTERLWDVARGEELNCFKGYESSVFSAVFSPDGATVLTASLDGTARLWAAGSGDELTCFKGHEDCVRSAVFSPDGEKMLTASDDGTARLWAADSREELKCFTGHEGCVISAVFSPDGEKVLTTSLDRTARLWDVASGEELKCFKGHESSVFSAVFSPDGEKVLTASGDGTVGFFDAETGAMEQRRLSLPDSWAMMDGDRNVKKAGPNAWKYIHGVKTEKDGTLSVVNPFDYIDAA